MRYLKFQFAIFLGWVLLSPQWGFAYDKEEVYPKEIIAIAKKVSCEPIYNFYSIWEKKAPGLDIGPPYAPDVFGDYGYGKETKEFNAAFWCKQPGSGVVLKIMSDGMKSETAQCPDTIKLDSKLPPGGLKIGMAVKDSNSSFNVGESSVNISGSLLSHFNYLGDRKHDPGAPPTHQGPAIPVSHDGIYSEHDGVSYLYYCHKGKWLVRSYH